MSLRQALGARLRGPRARRAVYAARVARAPLQYVVRRRWARRLADENEGACEAGPVIDPGLGFARLAREDLVGFDTALASTAGLNAAAASAPLDEVLGERSACALLLERWQLDVWRPGPDDHRVTHELLSDSRILAHPALLEFALQPRLVRAVSRYLGVLPYLARVGLPLSVPRHPLGQGAYYEAFHLDNDDTRHVKVYVHADDVGPDDGPLTFLPADTSTRVIRELRRRRRGSPYGSWPDDVVLQHCEASELVTLCGPRGAGALVDLSRCLHYGSRVATGHRRLELVLSFLRFHRPNANVSNQLHGACVGEHGPDWRRLLLQNPRPAPRDAHYSGEPPRARRADVTTMEPTG